MIHSKSLVIVIVFELVGDEARVLEGGILALGVMIVCLYCMISRLTRRFTHHHQPCQALLANVIHPVRAAMYASLRGLSMF